MWTQPATGKTQHYMLKPRDPSLAMRHSACGRTFLVGTTEPPKGKRCRSCERRSSNG